MKPKEIENTTWIQDFPRRISVIGTAMNEETSDHIDDEVDCKYLSKSGSNTISTCNSTVIAPTEFNMMTMLNKNLLNTIFKFNPFSKLKRFLVKKTGVEKTYYSLAEVLIKLKNIIRGEGMFDYANPSIILCSADLEEALNMKALHVTEIRDLVLSQMTKPPEQNLREFTQQTPDYISKTNLNLEPNYNHQQPQPLRIIRKANISKVIYMDKNAKFTLKPKFLKVIHSTPGADLKQTIFSYEEVTFQLSKYILSRKDDIFDIRNIKVALVENDLIGYAFGVKAFHRCQINNFIRNQLIPINPTCPTDMSNVRQNDNSPAVKVMSTGENVYIATVKENISLSRPSNPQGQNYPVLSSAFDLPTCFLNSCGKQNRAKKRNNAEKGEEQTTLAKQIKTTRQEENCSLGIEEITGGDVSQDETIRSKKIATDTAQENDIKEIQLLKKDMETLFAEKTTIEKQLKELEKIADDKKQKEVDIEKKFSVEKADLLMQVTDKEKALKDANTDRANLLKQIKRMEVEADLNDGYKKEIIELGAEMLKKKCKQYDDEASKNKILTIRLEQQKREFIALKETKKVETAGNILNTDIPVLRTLEGHRDTRSSGLTFRNMTSLLEDGISAPFSRPQAKAKVINHEECGIDVDIYSGILEALKETKKHKSDAEIQQRYGMLLEDLVERMPCAREKVVKSLNKAFRTLIPDITFENAPGASLKHSPMNTMSENAPLNPSYQKQFVTLSPRNMIQQKVTQTSINSKPV